MPAGVDFPRGAEFWTPGRADHRERARRRARGNLDTFGVFYVVGRFRPGLRWARARRRSMRSRRDSIARSRAG